MKAKIDLALRVLVGLLLIFAGSNKLFNFMPPQEMKPEMMDFMKGLMSTKYFFPLLGVSVVLVGLSLILNKYVNLALIILAPIAIHIVGVHLFLAPETGAAGYFLFIAALILGIHRIENYKMVLKP